MDKTILEVLIDYLEQIIIGGDKCEVQHNTIKESMLLIEGNTILTRYDPNNEMRKEVEYIVKNYKMHCIKTLSIISMKMNSSDFSFGVNTLTGEVTVLDNGHQEIFKSIYHFNYIFPLAYNI